MIRVRPWTPDQSIFEGSAGEALNVLPHESGYRPLQAFATYSTTPLSARAQGGYYTRATDGTPKQFAGDATKLYLLSGAAWGDASRLAGGAYATAADRLWDFAEFTGLVIAVNDSDAPQKFTIDSSANFAALGGSPPSGVRFVEVVGDFVVLADGRTLTWSALGNPEDYVASATTQSDSQELPDGGEIKGLVGYEYGALIAQERAFRRMDYEGPPLIFRFKRLTENIGCTLAGSLAGWGDRTFTLYRGGLYMIVGASEVVPVGSGKVDHWLWDDINPLYLDRVTAAVDPVNKIYGLSYPSNDSDDGTPDRLLILDWDSLRFSRAEPGDLEMIYSGFSQQSYTLDSLDGVSGSLDALPFSLESPVWTGVPQPLFAGFGTDHNLGYFNGPNLAATVDTHETQPIPGRRSRFRRLRPMVDGLATPSVALGTRNLLSEAPSFGSAVAVNALGFCPFHKRARYGRARITVPAAADWTSILGIDEVQAMPAGRR